MLALSEQVRSGGASVLRDVTRVQCSFLVVFRATASLSSLSVATLLSSSLRSGCE